MKHQMAVISLRVPQKDIYYISWIIDASEGLGFLKTEDPKSGEVTVFTPAELLCDMMECIAGLKNEGIDIRTVNAAAATGEII